MPSHNRDCECLECRQFWVAQSFIQVDKNEDGFISQDADEEEAGLFYSLRDSGATDRRRDDDDGERAERALNL